MFAAFRVKEIFVVGFARTVFASAVWNSATPMTAETAPNMITCVSLRRRVSTV